MQQQTADRRGVVDEDPVAGSVPGESGSFITTVAEPTVV